jgi:VanZ family protein
VIPLLPFSFLRKTPTLCYHVSTMDQPLAAREPIQLRVIKYWVPVAAMLGLMYYFSTDVFSAENTRSVIDKVFLWFVPHASKHALLTLNYIIRKSAHFIEYAVLGAFLFRAFRADDPTRWRLKWAFYSLLTAGAWALLDEFHQTLTRTRGGSIWDSLLDSSGAFFMLVAIAIVYRTPRTGEPQSDGRFQI